MPDFRGSPDSPFQRIGLVELTEAAEFTNRQFGVAAWWEKVLCKPQAVELKSNGYWVCWTFPGIVIDAHFPALFGGVAVSAYDKSRDVSRRSQYGFQWYAYGFAKQRMTGGLPGNMLFHLDAAFGCGVRTYGYRVDGGCETRTSYFLTVSEAAHA